MDVLKSRCGCGRILARLEQCPSCTEKRRAAAVTKAGPEQGAWRGKGASPREDFVAACTSMRAAHQQRFGKQEALRTYPDTKWAATKPIGRAPWEERSRRLESDYAQWEKGMTEPRGGVYRREYMGVWPRDVESDTIERALTAYGRGPHRAVLVIVSESARRRVDRELRRHANRVVVISHESGPERMRGYRFTDVIREQGLPKLSREMEAYVEMSVLC